MKNGDKVCVVAPAERHLKENTNLKSYRGYSVLRVKTGNLQKTNIVEKGISTLTIEPLFLSAIKKYYKNIKFDLVIYSTPPITFERVIRYIKRRNNAKAYLLLKDIFPQNAVDLKMFSRNSVFYKYFKRKERKLYKLSDYIGCMSQANVDYIVNNNPFIDKNRVGVAPNCIEFREKNKYKNKDAIKEKYKISGNAVCFVYGGNLGRPQGIPFLIECLKANEHKKDRYFVVCGKGTEYGKLKAYVDERKPDNVLLINGLPKEEYENFIMSCDVGLIFLDHRFTIPNFPSRILSYMQNSMPVIACTDVNTDMGQVILAGDFGWWCESNSVSDFTDMVDEACKVDLKQKGENAKKYLLEHYTSAKCYETIMEHIKE